MSHRTTRGALPELAWEGLFNGHDLGGLALRDGAQTVKGRIVRAGKPDRITADGWYTAYEFGIRTVIDLRNHGERGEAALRRPDLPFDVRLCPVEVPSDPVFVERTRGILAHTKYYPIVAELYPELIGAVFRAFAQSDGAVLFHCAAGRDRTGLVSAFLLSLSGVAPDAVLDDYARGFVTYNTDLRGRSGTREQWLTDDELGPILADRTDFLASWLSGFDVGDYLLSKGGLTAEEIDAVAGLLHPGCRAEVRSCVDPS